MKKTKALMKNNSMMKEIKKELKEEYQGLIKTKIKDKMKEIRMTEILLNKQNKQLSEMLSGKKIYSEEELLFGEDDD